MKKYPWEQENPINWDAEWSDIADQYADLYFNATNELIDHYFLAKYYKAACITGWCIAIILGICLVVVK